MVGLRLDRYPRVARMTARRFTAAFLLFLLLLGSDAAAQNALQLDKQFGNGGRVTTDFSGSTDRVRALARKSDGRLVAVGDSNQRGAVAQYLPTGDLDLSFGNGGKVVFTALNKNTHWQAVAVDAQGRILVAGRAETAMGDDNPVLVRFLANGSLDPAFNGIGWIETQTPGVSLWHALALQDDGRILVGGPSDQFSASSDFRLSRYNSNGSIDTSFGNAGTVNTDFGTAAWLWDLHIDAQGRIVAVGPAGPAVNDVTLGALARYLPDGSLDTGFNKGSFNCLITNTCGRFLVNLGLGPYDYPLAAAIRRADGSEDGRLLASGQFGVGRFTANGSLDGTFGQNGIAAALGTGEDIGIRSSGRVVVVARNGPDFRTILYYSNGQPVQGCDGQEVTTTDLAGGQDDAYAVLVQPNDFIVVGGNAEVNGNDDFALVRYRVTCFEIGPANPRDPSFFVGYFVAYHPLVPPWDKVGPPFPGAYATRFGEIAARAGDATSVFVPARFGNSTTPGSEYVFQRHRLLAGGSIGKARPARVEVKSFLGEHEVEVGAPRSLLFPVGLAVESTERLRGLEDAVSYACYDAGEVGRRKCDRKVDLNLTDAVNERYRLVRGRVTGLCAEIRSERNRVERDSGLLCFDAKGAALRTRERSVQAYTSARWQPRLATRHGDTRACIPVTFDAGGAGRSAGDAVAGSAAAVSRSGSND